MFLRSRIRRLWTDSLRFHGKPCTLLALGVRVCDTAMTHLGLSDPGLDRLVCVSEHDGCCVDAIQIGLHCTSGRKHLLYYKTGRLIFTVYDLESGASVRICTLPELTEAIPTMTAQQILSAPEDALFYFEEAHPLTQRVLDKVHRACNAPAEDIPHRTSGVQDSPEQFQKFEHPAATLKKFGHFRLLSENVRFILYFLGFCRISCIPGGGHPHGPAKNSGKIIDVRVAADHGRPGHAAAALKQALG